MTSRVNRFLTKALLIINIIDKNDGFQLAPNQHYSQRTSTNRCSKLHLLQSKSRSDDEDVSINANGKNAPENPKDTAVNEFDIDTLLDTPIFDPDKSDGWFGSLVRNDYNTAEALYAGLVIAIGVIVSQEALRVIKYGGGYVPFHGSGGQLF